jgi:hypothetical protein
MTYALSPHLQTAVFQHLANADHGGAAVHDQPPSGTIEETYITFGGESVTDRSDASTQAADHDFTLSVVSAASSFLQAKSVAAKLSEALDGADLALARGQLTSLRFYRATARRDDKDGLRRIDLRFRARVEDN